VTTKERRVDALQNKLIEEMERCNELRADVVRKRVGWAADQNKLVSNYSTYLSQLEDEMASKLDEDASVTHQVDTEANAVRSECLEQRSQLEDDVDTEIDNLRVRYEAQVDAEHEAMLQYVWRRY